jgi:hypothetical protein
MGNFQTYVTTSALARFGFSNRPVICVDANGEGAGVRLKRAKNGSVANFACRLAGV